MSGALNGFPLADWDFGAGDQSPGGPLADTLQVPFLPLNHQDRILISPAELLHVVAVKPHELPHMFKLLQA